MDKFHICSNPACPTGPQVATRHLVHLLTVELVLDRNTRGLHSRWGQRGNGEQCQLWTWAPGTLDASLLDEMETTIAARMAESLYVIEGVQQEMHNLSTDPHTG